MVWLIVIVAIAVLGFGAMVAAGAYGAMSAEPVHDDFIPTLPATRLMGEDLDGIRFQIKLRGYDMASVDRLLDRLGREADQREAELAELREIAVPAGGSTKFSAADATDAE